MTTSTLSKSTTGSPWQLRILKDDNTLKVVTKVETAAIVPANDSDADNLFAGRQHPQFLPRFLQTPDGMEWS